jgi:DNA-directed RNA polymerase specialized sigma24 family protein
MISICRPLVRSRGGEAAFVTASPRLFAIAYRYLRDVGEAEDVVQETWLRWDRADRSVVANPPAFLAMTATRLAINVAGSARRRRVTYVGPWLLDEAGFGRAGREPAAERYEAVDLAVRLLLEKLSPVERAAYLLRKGLRLPLPANLRGAGPGRGPHAAARTASPRPPGGRPVPSGGHHHAPTPRRGVPGRSADR